MLNFIDYEEKNITLTIGYTYIDKSFYHIYSY